MDDIREISVYSQMWVLRLHQQYKNIHIPFRLMQAKTEFNPVPEKFNFPHQEEKTLQFWHDQQCFKKQLEITKDFKPFTFYDGPPFATGTPHYGHICAGTIKDVVCRYASQTGHHVTRRFGWDCHGLPVEYEIDKALGITDRKQILDMGIGKYNEECRSIVMRYSSLWQKVVNRFGRWIDFENDYKTMDIRFMESVWHVFKALYEKGLVYRGRKIMPYSNAVHTVLSNFEVQQNYQEVMDPSLWVTFPQAKHPEVKFLVWTTTPWTLPSNLVLAVNPSFVYLKVKDIKRNEVFILAECRLNSFYQISKKKKTDSELPYQILQKMKGEELKGIEYVPIFDFFLERGKDGCFRVQTADFVTDDAGTGIVHCAPGFGEDDYKLCVREKLIHPDKPVLPLDEGGKFTSEVPTYAGMYVKDADEKIVEELKNRGRVARSEKQKHSYPFCWRSDTPLIYKAVSTWFIKVTEIKQKLIANNFKANWVPKAIQEKKFHNWIKDSQDWCFSRSRYWGNPIPLWVSEDGEEIVCVGSVRELEELTGATITDLHRESIDHLTIKSKRGKGDLKRIEEVFDCWFESGSMPYAQVHYPFSTSEEEFSKIFPADFIGEGTDQTRGWFYTLNVIATGLRDSNPYKNLIVNGLVLNEEGKKMSKRLKNYPEPEIVCDELGADAIRLYLINSPLVRADSLNFTETGVRDVIRNVFLPWYNVYRMLIQSVGKWESSHDQQFKVGPDLSEFAPRFNVTDCWIQSALQTLIAQVRKEMQQYKLYNVVPPLVKFLENLTNWYVRMNRQRLKGQVDSDNMTVSINVLFDVLMKVNILMSPHVPFFTEHMYQNLKKCLKDGSQMCRDSIHHLMIPEVQAKFNNLRNDELMQITMNVIETARHLREKRNLSLKQPITSLTLVVNSQQLSAELKPFLGYMEDETNAAEVKFEENIDKYVKLTCLPNLPVLGPKFKGNKNFPEVRDAIVKLSSQELKNAKQKGQVQVAGHTVALADILITEKFIEENIQEHEVIGGEKVIVLLDTRQNEELRTKGYARELINRIQKLKKKAHLRAEDQILIFYHFQEGADNLQKAMSNEAKMIRSAVKKPLHPLQNKCNTVEIAAEEGNINGENYAIVLTYLTFVPQVKNLHDCFGPKAEGLAQALATKSYRQNKDSPSISIRLDGEDYELLRGKHYLTHDCE